MTQVVKRSSDSRVTPARVLAGHLNHQLLYFNGGLGTARSSDLAAVVLPRDQLSMPSKQSVWGDQSIELEKPLSADRLDRESTTLLIGESQSLPAQLLEQDSFSSRRYTITRAYTGSPSQRRSTSEIAVAERSFARV